MKKYLTSNNIAPRDYLWRAFLITFLLGAIAIIGGVYRLTSNKNISRALQNSHTTQVIAYLGTGVVTEGQQITITSGSLIAEPAQITYLTGDDTLIGIDTTITCNDFFNQGTMGAVATTEALCVVDNNHKQQVITRTQINQARIKADLSKEIRPDSYPTIASLFTSDPLILDQSTMQALSDELALATDDQTVLKGLQTIAKITRRPLMFGLIVVYFFFNIFFVLFAIFLPVVILALIAQVISAISGQKLTYTQAFSRTRLPSTLMLLLVWFVPFIKMRMALILWLIFPIHDAIHQKK